MSTNIYQYLYLFLLISTNIYQYLAISLISISTNIYQYPISTWHVGDQPVNVLLAAEGGDALVQDHDGVELPGLGRPPHLGPVPHGARHHGVTHPGPEPWPPADTDIVDVGQISRYNPGHLMEATWPGVEASLEGTTSTHSEAVTAIGAAVAAVAVLLLGAEV